LTSHVCCFFQNGAKQLKVDNLCKKIMTPQNKLLLIMCAWKFMDYIPTSLIIKMWFALHYNNLLTCVTMTTDLLDFMTMTIKFYMDNGITKLLITMYLSIFRILFLHSYNDALSYLTLCRIHRCKLCIKFSMCF
jgi:hypothetical protein